MTILRRLELLLIGAASAPATIWAKHYRLLRFHVLALQLLLCAAMYDLRKSTILMQMIGKNYR
jgi:hypothetical protein